MQAALTLSLRTFRAPWTTDPVGSQLNGGALDGGAPCLGLALLLASGAWVRLFAAASLLVF
jgi:hypothetical protein